MIQPKIEKLLIVQSKDVALQKIKQQIEQIPKERVKIKGLIEQQKASIEVAKSELNAKEVEKNNLDSQIKLKESNIEKFKMQQLEVKRNEEYKALNCQIEQAQNEISELENNEIEIMYSIDEAKITFEEEVIKINSLIDQNLKHLTEIETRIEQLNDDHEEAKVNYLESRKLVDSDSLAIYDITKTQVKRPPYISAIEAQNCSGCHLRVSNDVLGIAISGEEIIACDQCARIIYKT